MHSGTFLKTFAAAGVAAATLAGATGSARAADQVPAAQQNWNLLFGATLTSQYINRGIAQSSGAAIQPWAEFDVGPVYFGYWGSNVSPAWVGANWEHDLSIGIRHAVGPVSLDGGYVRYIYNNGDCCGELYLKGSINPIMPLTIGASVFLNPSSADGPQHVYVEGNAKFKLTDQISISGAIGNQTYYAGSDTFSWNFGASWNPVTPLTFDIRYYGGPAGAGANKVVVSAAWATDIMQFGKGGLFY